MGLWAQTKNIAGAKYSRFLKRAENPIETLDFAYEKELEMLQKFRRALVKTVTAKKRLVNKRLQVGAKITEMERAAKAALEAERPDIAEALVRRKLLAAKQAETMGANLAGLEQQQADLGRSCQIQEDRIEQFRTARETYGASFSAAEAQMEVRKLATGLSDTVSIGTAVEKVKEKTEEMQAEAEAIDELVTSGQLPISEADGGMTTLDRQLADTEVKAELERIKGGLPASEEKPALAAVPKEAKP